MKDLDPETDRFLQQLNLLYSEMGQRAITPMGCVAVDMRANKPSINYMELR